MFFKKSAFALAFVALANVVAAGQTPACLLSVIGGQPNPADLGTICGADSKKVESAISDKCGPNSPGALQFFANTCNQAGHKVAVSTTGSGTSPTGTGNGFITSVSTNPASGAEATGSSSGGSAGGSSSASGSASSPSASHGAAASDRQFSATAFAAAVFMGAAALL